MPGLVRPHGGGDLNPLLLAGSALEAERERAKSLPRLRVSSREKGDIVMLGIGGFTPLEGFMTHADWRGVCNNYRTASGLFWPILGEGLSFVEAKLLRVLAITSDQRLPHAPDVPTLQELGYPITAGTMRGLAFPGGVPKEAVTTMEAALEQVHKSAAWRELAKRNILQDVFMGSADFTKYLAQRLEEARSFYDAIGLGKPKP